VNDFSAALSVAEDLVRSDPADPRFRHYRAEAYEHLNDYTAALADYINVVQLLGEPRRVAASPFYMISLMYAALGRYCDAITPIETYVSFDPANRQSTQSAKLIAEYAEKGNCHTHHASGFARVRFPGAVGVHTLSVVVNGVAGNFILDTGATYVAVTSDFAQRAKVMVEGANVISMKTVGGVASAYLSHANKIVVGSAEAQGVAVAVIRGAVDPFGGRLDGLLGMSFLARFKVTLTQSGLELKAIPLR
jgi:aspartyl protease family protein